ncbi:TPA: hypothetical protein J9282_005268, partial [Escherichia coli]|nr:hypothetical protein [Escherichia coli]
MFAGKKSAQIREILISESAWEEMTCLFAPSLDIAAIQEQTPEEKALQELDTEDQRHLYLMLKEDYDSS